MHMLIINRDEMIRRLFNKNKDYKTSDRGLQKICESCDGLITVDIRNQRPNHLKNLQ